jgi:hypothetical protein
MPVIFYKNKRRIVRFKKSDKKLICSWAKRFFNGEFIEWTRVRQLPEYKACWFANLLDNKRGLSHLYYTFTKAKKYFGLPSSAEASRKTQKINRIIYKDVPKEKKPAPKTIWSKKDLQLLERLTTKYRWTKFVNWSALSRDKLFKKLPIQKIEYLRIYFNANRRNNLKDQIQYRRKKALEYKLAHKDRFLECQRKRQHKKVIIINKYLREEASKQGRYICAK